MTPTHHPVSDDRPGGLWVAGEETEGVAGVEDESLTVRHGGEILQHQAELGPVGEDLPVAAVGDELLGELRHPGVQVVQQHVDDGGGVTRPHRENNIEMTGIIVSGNEKVLNLNQTRQTFL